MGRCFQPGRAQHRIPKGYHESGALGRRGGELESRCGICAGAATAPAAQRRPSRAPCPAPLQRLATQFRVALLLATGLLAYETQLKFSQPSNQFATGNALTIVNTCIACVCLAAVLGVGCALAWRVRRGAAAACGRAGQRAGGLGSVQAKEAARCPPDVTSQPT